MMMKGRAKPGIHQRRDAAVKVSEKSVSGESVPGESVPAEGRRKPMDERPGA